ncbi:17146_t:CDS:2 [Funneliformis geosporum]|uniref:17146_t:CDS:1 n=1 Tax=Funneliformis geosporum TaxID=1117311 RepID=A0A9W4SP04_9GLOM|nr:17146_t:CDS:2 [Funneliformis geosporum]
MLHLGSDRQICNIWMEDDHRNFITYIPPNIDPPYKWYQFYCNGSNGKNRIGTLNTLDNSTTYWVHASMDETSTAEKIRGGYNENKCFDLHGATGFKWYFEEHDYNDCKRIRDGN